MAQNNPFFHRGPVRDPTYFSGRAREVNFLTALLCQGQSVAISGPRRFGKTSLLFYITHPDVAAAHGLGDDTTRRVYLDGGMLDGLSEESFYGAVDRALGGTSDTISYPRFVERLRVLAAQNLRCILAVDEFELIAANARLGRELFNRLRGLATHLPLQFITASKDPLVQLTFAHPETLSSPFFNMFAPLFLTVLADDEAVNLLAMLSARGGRPFTPDTLGFLFELAGPHPLFLQVAGYHAFAALGSERTQGTLSAEARVAVQSQALADLAPHLQYYWNSLNPEARYTLASLPLYGNEGQSSAVEQLYTAGLLRRGTYLGRVLETFVRRQQVEGLLQAGQFILDVHRGLAAVCGNLVHLTPTEFAALRIFLSRPGQLVSLEAIEAALWPGEIVADPERARGVVKKLRAALGLAGKTIVNSRGQGYLLSLD